MASIISAGTTSGTALNMSADTTGSLILATNGSTTALTINTSQNATFAGSVTATGGIIVGASAAPAFSATPVTTQSITSGVYTKVTLGTKNFDTNNNFASSRFTPTVAGYYQFNSAVYVAVTGGNPVYIWNIIYKSGVATIYGNLSTPVGAGLGTDGIGISSGLLYMNGSTDYVESYIYASAAAGTIVVGGAGTYTQFSGCFIRSA